MQIEHLKEFLLLSEHMNFSAAAREACITQPAFSNHIRGLEKELGKQLVERSAGVSQTLKFTAAGEALLEGASEILAVYEQMILRVNNASGETENRVLVQCGHLGSNIIMSCADIYMKENPQANVIITSVNNENMLEKLRRGGCDCTPLYRSLGEPSEAILSEFDIVPLETVETLLWLDASNPLCHQDTVSIDALRSATFPVLAGSHMRFWIDSLTSVFTPHGFLPKLITRYAESTDDFYRRIKPEEVLFIGSDIMDDPLFKQPGRILLPFDDPLMLTTWLVFRRNAGLAVEGFKHLVERESIKHITKL